MQHDSRRLVDTRLAVKAALPKKRRLTAADIGALQREYADTVRPARQAAAELLRLERVNDR